jgi:glycerol-3-phosphate dehydrogenase (NAD(P)+)
MITTRPLPISVLGAGSWGTALAILLARNSQNVRLWGRGDYVGEMAKTHCNQCYLPDVVLPQSLQILTDIQEAMHDVRDVLIAVPSHAFRQMMIQVAQYASKNIRIAWATKGLDPETHHLLHEVVVEIFGHLPMAILAGPSFAKEVAKGLPTAITLASNDEGFSHDLLQRLHSHSFRVYTQADLIGVQVCGAVKNVLAVATGISDGLNLGANARAALITRGLAEMVRLGKAMGGESETFMGLAGLGDLVLTCTDDQSRNRRFGFAVGRGADIEQAERSIGQVVESRRNAFEVLALAKQLQVDMPITEQVCCVLQQKINPNEAVRALLEREQKPERLL